MRSKRAGLIGMVCVRLLVSAILFMATAGRLQAAIWMGPLTVHASNPRYFSDGSKKAIYLAGSHTWNGFQEDTYRPALDYKTYLDFLDRHNHNFARLWVWEQATWAPWTTAKGVFEPLPYLRTGPGAALDGEPKFDLNRFNQRYFDRLRDRVSAARDRGIYVAIMLFQGWSYKKLDMPGDPWPGHPYNKYNNINSIDGGADGVRVHTLTIPAITALQEAYVRKVVDTVNDLDNVLYEIANESHGGSIAWQYHMINLIKNYEASKPKQHPIGMTITMGGGSNAELFASPADWISPSSAGGYEYDPPAADGSKIIIPDTDHFWGIGGNQGWVWKSFLRGLNPIFMDPYTAKGRENHPSRPDWEPIRKSMGYTLLYAKKMNLAAMVPSNDLASTRYCLADPGVEYLVYLPAELRWIESLFRRMRLISLVGLSRVRALSHWIASMFRQTVTVDLSAASGDLFVEWFNPSTGEAVAAGITTGGVSQDFTAPFRGDAVLYLSKTASSQ